jgi:hypothetical protein
LEKYPGRELKFAPVPLQSQREDVGGGGFFMHPCGFAAKPSKKVKEALPLTGA